MPFVSLKEHQQLRSFRLASCQQESGETKPNMAVKRLVLRLKMEEYWSNWIISLDMGKGEQLFRNQHLDGGIKLCVCASSNLLVGSIRGQMMPDASKRTTLGLRMTIVGQR